MSKNEISALSAIRRYCISCSGDSKVNVQRCDMKNCPLYQYRFGATRKKVQANDK